jgi:hypothetical protein
MALDIGWSGNYRAGHWTPIYVTAVDDSGALARTVTLDIVTPQGSSFALNIRNQFVVHPEPNTYLLYAPLGFRLDETVAVIRDAQTGKRLAEKVFDSSTAINNEDGPISFATAQHGDEILIGVGGRQSALRMLQRSGTIRDNPANVSSDTAATEDLWKKLEYLSVQVGFLDAKLLPDTPMGYDGLHLLVLNGPDLLEMSLRQQQAIAAWIKGGGRLLLWPGDGIVPDDSPIARLLPCKIGENETVSLTVEDTKKLGVASRLEKLPGRKVTPLPGSTKFDTLLGKAQVHIGRAGIGSVAVVSVDASQLVFNGEKEAQKFWWPVLGKLIDISHMSPANRQYWQPNPEEARRVAALETVIDRLGDVPGVGKFDFSYIAVVMIAMMFIVGPIDWFVLKKLGRQPWTWITTGGWIALVTFGALYVGRVFKSGELHYRTVRLIDQADGEVVGAMDVVGIYSPRTQSYGLNGPRDAWWEPANAEAETMPWRRARQHGLTDVFLGQDGRGTLPGSMTVNVWNLRFMQSELGDPSSVAPVLKADLRRVGAVGAANERIIGTITNLSAMPLRNVRLRTKRGSVVLRPGNTSGTDSTNVEVLKPHEALRVDFASASMLYPESEAEVKAGQLHAYARANGTPIAEQAPSFLYATCDIQVERTDRVEELLQRTDLACIYAESEDVAPAVTLEHKNGVPAREKHWQVVRAIVELK